MPHPAAIVTYPTARKQYDCSEQVGCTIHPGERHVREAIPPWVLMQDDPDDPPAPIGEWWVRRFHSRCATEPF